MLQSLPQDKDKQEDLLLHLMELRAQPAYQVVLQHLRTQLQISQRELESETLIPRFHQLQGEIAAYRKSLGALDFLEQQLKKET
jgi:hypothetical protein